MPHCYSPEKVREFLEPQPTEHIYLRLQILQQLVEDISTDMSILAFEGILDKSISVHYTVCLERTYTFRKLDTCVCYKVHCLNAFGTPLDADITRRTTNNINTSQTSSCSKNKDSALIS